MEIFRRFASQNNRSIPEGIKLKRGGSGTNEMPQVESDESPGESISLKAGGAGAEGPLGEGRHDVTVGQALRNRRLRNCFLALSFALSSLVLAYYGASFGIASFSGEHFTSSIPCFERRISVRVCCVRGAKGTMGFMHLAA